MDYRVILYHKHPTSARTRFLKFRYNSVFAFAPLVKLAQLSEGLSSKTPLHPAIALQQVTRQLGLPADILRIESPFQHYVDVPGEPVQIILIAITSQDPPFAIAEQLGAQFIDLMQARGLAPVELELLRLVYEWALGG